MAHRNMVGGTAYDTTGGRALVDGAVYGIQKGKTMVDGTAVEVGFLSNIIPVIITKGRSSTTDAYVRFVTPEGTNAKRAAVGEYEMVRGGTFEAYVNVSGYTSYSTIYLNDVAVATAQGFSKTYKFVPDCKSITVEITGNKPWYVRIYTT